MPKTPRRDVADDRCSYNGKVRYPTKQRAKHSAKYLNSNGEQVVDKLTVYRCPVCEGWHLTKRSSQARARQLGPKRNRHHGRP